MRRSRSPWRRIATPRHNPITHKNCSARSGWEEKKIRKRVITSCRVLVGPEMKDTEEQMKVAADRIFALHFGNANFDPDQQGVLQFFDNGMTTNEDENGRICGNRILKPLRVGNGVNAEDSLADAAYMVGGCCTWRPHPV